MWNGLCVFCQHGHWVFRYTSWGHSSGITTFPFVDNLVSNHQVPILPTHSKKVTMTRFSVMAYTSDNYKTRGTHSGNTDQAPLCSRCSTMAQTVALLSRCYEFNELTFRHVRSVSGWKLRDQSMYLLNPARPEFESNSAT